MLMQEIYTKVKAHLLAQNAKSANGTSFAGLPRCFYRSPGGLKCAVGALIPDELYDPDLEGYGVEEQPVIEVLVAAGVLDGAGHFLREDKVNLLERLQRVHDLNEPHQWPESLAEVAADFDLEDV